MTTALGLVVVLLAIAGGAIWIGWRRGLAQPAEAEAPDQAAPTPQDRKRLAAEFGRLVAQADALMAMCLERGAHAPMHQVEDWEDAVSDAVREALGRDAVERWRTVPVEASAAAPADAAEAQRRLWSRVEAGRARLQALAAELRP